MSSFQDAKPKPDEEEEQEQIELLPTTNKIDYCIACHRPLKWRKPNPLEAKAYRQFFMENFDQNICRDEDVYAVTDPCECGQQGVARYNVNMDRLK